MWHLRVWFHRTLQTVLVVEELVLCIKGRYKHEAVAIKEFLTSAQAEHTGDTLEDQRSHHSEDDDIIRQEEALFLFR